MNGLDLRKYERLALKRKWWIVVPFLVTCLVGLTYGLLTPKIYEAKTLILVQSQRVPQDFVRSIVSEKVDNRLRTISQQVTSRTNLENIIREHKLYSEPRKFMDERVELFREDIVIDVSKGDRQSISNEPNAFTISYRSESPRKAMEIANTLASNFISENLRIRESQAMGTSSFLADELENVQLRLSAKEDELKQYREKFMGGLPEQLDTNLRILERLQAQLDQLQNNLRDCGKQATHRPEGAYRLRNREAGRDHHQRAGRADGPPHPEERADRPGGALHRRPPGRDQDTRDDREDAGGQERGRREQA